jgi:AhpD family alkylhydroperoxidase
MTTETPTLEARMAHPVFVVPGANEALQALHKSIAATGLSPKLTELISLRASQINGCGACAVQHPKIARKLGETDDRLFAVAAWRDAPFFTDAERVALELTEALTRMADKGDPVRDELWDEAARCFDETELAAVLLAISSINVWNRLNVATRQVAGAEW